ncbi:MAG: hypothetical protein A2V66_01840 [Ignavibacteria bacterium RBG_13_36_8]|nr:MAG: hypothetical protein A2V66_01840 [Ignavibacteria bacterium RBG_13_36_8]
MADSTCHLLQCPKCGKIGVSDLMCIECATKSSGTQTSNNERYAINLLKLWMAKKPRDWMPGAWEYDEAGAELVDDTAKFLGIPFPWAD